MYFGLSHSKPHYSETDLLFAKYQVSFRYELIDLYQNFETESRLTLNLAYTQTSFWDLETRSQPFYDNNFKPAMFLFYEKIGGNSLSWAERFDLEGGFQHHSNGRDGFSSRSIDWVYIQPTAVWRALNSYFIVSPKIWTYLGKSSLNEDIEDFWGYVNIELTWRADFGLQVRTYTNPAKESTSFLTHVTFPMSKVWKPLKFYMLISYYTGTGETIIDFDQRAEGFIFGFALSR